jgi:cytochrome c oxidase subunit 3
MKTSSPVVAHQFDDIEQQRAAGVLGMWIFLATEVLFFGGLFTAYAVFRWMSPPAFAAASRHLDIVLGTVNTGVLLTSSLTMALAVRAAQSGERKSLLRLLVATVFLGGCFLVIKGAEYHHKFVEHLVPGVGFEFQAAPKAPAELFFWLYFAMTGLHALHVIIGMGLIGYMAIRSSQPAFLLPEKYLSIEIAGLYWHFVDIVWVFLFPLLYLIGGR